MSKDLEALERIKENCDLLDDGYQWDETFSKLFTKDIATIEKSLKALEIIKKKEVDINSFKRFVEKDTTCETYNELFRIMSKIDGIDYSFKYLTQEEYDLLREVLL